LAWISLQKFCLTITSAKQQVLHSITTSFINPGVQYRDSRHRYDKYSILYRYWLVMSTIPKRKHKRSDIEANYRNETKTFWFGPHTIGTKAKHFDLVQNNFYCKQIVYVLAQKFWDKAKQFDLVCKLS
jgi:hypothetical protein